MSKINFSFYFEMDEAWINVYRDANDNIVVGDVHKTEPEAKNSTVFPGRKYLKTVKLV